MRKTETPLDYLRKNIWSLRNASEPKITQEKVAAATGMSYKYYQSLEAGRIANPTYESVFRLSQFFKIDYWKLWHPLEIPEVNRDKTKPKKKK